MIEFICGFGIGVLLSLLYVVATNLFKQHPNWRHFLDIKDDIAAIKKRIDELLKKTPK